MHIEAVTVCVRYADFLREVAPHNRPLLHRWLIVTEPSDQATRDVCREFSLECLLCEDFSRDGGFAKARGINRGLDQLQGDDWLLHLDADIALPFDLHPCLEDACLDRACLYGCDRLNVTGAPMWDALRSRGLYSRENGWLTEFRQGRQGAWLGGRPGGLGRGYAPIGFFQLWHGDQTHTWSFPRKRYPERHTSAARTDVQFACLWDRPQRLLLPELVVFHLESQPAPMGANWNGRSTPPFRSSAGPTAAASSAAQIAAATYSTV